MKFLLRILVLILGSAVISTMVVPYFGGDILDVTMACFGWGIICGVWWGIGESS